MIEPEIVYSSVHGDCWARFTIAKELMHVLDDQDESITFDIERLLDRMSSESPPGIFAEVDAEFAAVFGAIEMLMPERSTSIARSMLKNGESYHDVAKKFMMPERMVKERMQAEINDFFDEAYKAKIL